VLFLLLATAAAFWAHRLPNNLGALKAEEATSGADDLIIYSKPAGVTLFVALDESDASNDGDMQLDIWTDGPASVTVLVTGSMTITPPASSDSTTYAVTHKPDKDGAALTATSKDASSDEADAARAQGPLSVPGSAAIGPPPTFAAALSAPDLVARSYTRLRVTSPTVRFGFCCNGPPFSLTDESLAGTPNGTMDVTAPTQARTWQTESVSPTFGDAFDSWTGVTLTPGGEASGWTSEWAGTDSEKESSAELNLFYAGILYGLAGALVIVVLQELADGYRERRKAES
jgi:hypothetical protein